MTPVLSVEKISKTYESGGERLRILQNISFAVGKGESVSILGPSGSGKTTLLGICAGLDDPSEGDVVLDGLRLADLPQEKRAALRNDSVGFIFQTFRLIPTLTAMENIMVPLEIKGRRDAAQKAARLLDLVHLTDRAGHYPNQLSGGEQQRVGLARAFINEPKILFADEPTGNLDNENSERVAHLLFELNRTSGTSLVLVTHDEEMAKRTHVIYRLKKGRLDHS